MFKLLSWLIFIPFAIVVVVFAVSNRGPIPINFWPLPFSEQVPLYLITLGTLAVGAFVGGLLTWLSAAKWHMIAASRGSDIRYAENEIDRLKKKIAELEEKEVEPKQEVLPAVKVDAA